jgi:hypothetical protein
MIGYLDVQQLDPAGYLGGLLVVDDFGLPVEFRHSVALRPTKLQRTLYGDALDRYLRSRGHRRPPARRPRAAPRRRPDERSRARHRR